MLDEILSLGLLLPLDGHILFHLVEFLLLVGRDEVLALVFLSNGEVALLLSPVVVLTHDFEFLLG